MTTDIHGGARRLIDAVAHDGWLSLPETIWNPLEDLERHVAHGDTAAIRHSVDAVLDAAKGLTTCRFAFAAALRAAAREAGRDCPLEGRAYG